MADQCNQCGSFLNLTRCETCTTILCANCRGGHEKNCASIQARKARGDGQTVRRVNTLPEPKAEVPVPELHPVDDPKQDEVVAGVPAPDSDVDVIASLAGPVVTLEPNEGPYIISRAEGQAGTDGYTEASNETEIQSVSESVLQSEQNSDAPSVVEGSTVSDGSDSVPAADAGRHDSDASGGSGNAPSAPEPEVEMVDPATADGE